LSTLTPSQIIDGASSRAAAAEQPAEKVVGVFEPPTGLVVPAIGRYKLIVLAVAAVCALGGIGLGLSRERTYTASATLQVGQVNPNSPGFLGYVQSATALATAFSRAITAEPVLVAVQHKLKLTSSQAAARLSAEPIPLSPSFVVYGTGPTAKKAIELANVAGNAVVAYESQSNSANPEAASLLGEYREAALEVQHASQHLNLSVKQHASANARAEAQAERNTALVKLKAIATAYSAAVSSQAPRSGLVSVLAGATSASNDRNSNGETFGLIGLLLGIVVGCGTAVVLEMRRRRLMIRS